MSGGRRRRPLWPRGAVGALPALPALHAQQQDGPYQIFTTFRCVYMDIWIWIDGCLCMSMMYASPDHTLPHKKTRIPYTTYTQIHTQAKRDMADPRAASFLRLCALLAEMRSPPTYIALENVEVRMRVCIASSVHAHVRAVQMCTQNGTQTQIICTHLK